MNDPSPKVFVLRPEAVGEWTDKMYEWLGFFIAQKALVPVSVDDLIAALPGVESEVTWGIEVWGDGEMEPVRPIWLVHTIRLPLGEITASEWNGMTVAQRRERREQLLRAALGETDE